MPASRPSVSKEARPASTPCYVPGVAAVPAELPGLLDRVGAWQGTWIEEKGRAVAVHTRRAQDPQAAYEALRAPLAELATRHGLIVEPGRMVLELRPPGMDKGMASDGLAAAGGTPAAFGTLLEQEMARWQALVRKRGIKVE